MSRIKKILVAITAFALLFAGSVVPFVKAAAPWNVTGSYEVTFFLNPDLSTTPYTHHATLVQTGTVVTGDGGYPATGVDTYHWNITSGTQTGNSLNLTALYDLGATGTVMNMTGTIAPDGTVTGTWDDNFGGPRTGTWSITKGVSVPLIHTPANNATVTQSALVKVDWTDSIGANPPFEYQYEAFSDAAYTSTSSIYLSGWLVASEIPTLGTPPGVYYLRVKARNFALLESAWSNGAGNAYKVTVVTDPIPDPYAIPAECDQSVAYNVIIGTDNSETINGTSGRDLIFGKAGADTINGRSNDDCISGGVGSDVINAGSGEDVALGGDGQDTINSGSGDDKAYGGDDPDLINSGSGNDQAFGGNGNDTVNGGSGNDTLDGEAGASDTLNGGAGTDTCSGEVESSCEL